MHAGAEESDPSRPPLRKHQQLAIGRIVDARTSGADRAWVVLPPGSGKTRVGLERALDVSLTEPPRPSVVFCPNTAIQGQWLAQAEELGLQASTDRGLVSTFTSLTYQSLAVFDPSANEQGEPESEEESGTLIDGLHPNGRALIQRLRDLGPVLLILDECHHLLEVWGRLIDEILTELPQAHVLGLTATPPGALSADQRELVERLFGEIAYETSIPSVVREGDLAPFAELTWVTTPTDAESRWLAAEAERFAELTTQLLDPSFGSTSFLTWLDLRFVHSTTDLSWAQLSKREPALCAAALRMHYAGLLDLPEGARLNEEHRLEPTAENWVALIDDWVRGCIGKSAEDKDQAVVDRLKASLPAVGYVWTRRGIRRGRSTIDRVLARSASKQTAAVGIAAHEAGNLGSRARVLALCDHESASAMLPVDLEGVIDQQTGSALALLDAMLSDPGSAQLAPLLVTGQTVAGARDTLEALIEHVRAADRELAESLEIAGDGQSAASTSSTTEGDSPTTEGVSPTPETGAARLEGSWTSRLWVTHITDFFESGGTQLLVGTRGLLGEGWNARSITCLIDLTASTTITSVVQTRGRALRTIPAWPDKVALNWSLACVDHVHPKGDNDWDRLVRKHAGFYATDAEGEIVDGVAHIDASLSPYAPPPRDELDGLNARMLMRAERRVDIATDWRVGEPYADEIAHTIRVITPRRAGAKHALTAQAIRHEPPAIMAGPEALKIGRLPTPDRVSRSFIPSIALGLTGFAGLVVAANQSGTTAVRIFDAAGLILMALAVLVVIARERRWRVAQGHLVLEAASRPPTVFAVAAAVADALHATGDVSRDSRALDVHMDADGDYRCRLTGVSEPESALFARTLDEALGPVMDPRYVVCRWTLYPPKRAASGYASRAMKARRGRLPADAVVWHPVPSSLGNKAARARLYARSWNRWIGGGDALFTGSPQGAGVLASQRGADPFAATTVTRRQWS